MASSPPVASPTMSVAMATFNGARFLPDQLASIAAQSRPPDELVIADDGSGDATVAIVEAFARTSPFPVHLLRQPRNIGILENFHAAFARCRGRVICSSDQDDVWRPDKLARVAQAFGPQVALVMHQSEVVDADLVTRQAIAPGNPRYGRLRFPVAAHRLRGFAHQMAFDRGVLATMHRLRPVVEAVLPGDLAHEFDQYIPFCASLVGEVVVLPDPLVRFRRHAGATSGAGAAIAPASSRAARLAWVIERDRRVVDGRLRILKDAAAAGLLGDRVAALLRAMRCDAAIGGHLMEVARAPTRRAQVRSFAAALLGSMNSGRFGNVDRRRDVVLALAAAVLRPLVSSVPGTRRTVSFLRTGEAVGSPANVAGGGGD